MKAIDWKRVAGDLADKVRDETRSKYFPRNPLRRMLISRFLERVGAALGVSEWQSLLDVGCGEGFVDYYLSHAFPGLDITGVEPDPQAREVARGINPSFAYVDSDARALPFPDGSFDVVICLEVLEHLTDFRRVIEEAGRVSKGPCIFSVPAWPFYQGANFLIGKNWSRLGEHPDHVVRFTRRRLQRELSSILGDPVFVRLSFPWLIGICAQ